MRQNEKLLLFPGITAVCTALIVLLFFFPIAAQPTDYSYTSFSHWSSAAARFFSSKSNTELLAAQPGDSRYSSRLPAKRSDSSARVLGIVYFAALYLAVLFSATFINVAFYHQILRALKGEPIGIRLGLAFALTRWKAILLWTMFAGAIGIAIKHLEERFGFVGSLVMKFIGTAWSVAAVFVIPVLIQEKETIHPVTLLKKSAFTLKQTWGESLIGYVGVTLGGIYALLFSFLWLGGGIFLAFSARILWLIPFVILSWLMLIIAAGWLLSIASQIFRCALFLYATEGALPAPYSEDLVAQVWKMKKS